MNKACYGLSEFMVRFYDVFFIWICNKRGDFSSPCFPLDLLLLQNFCKPRLAQEICKLITGKLRKLAGNCGNEPEQQRTASSTRCQALHTQQLQRPSSNANVGWRRAREGSWRSVLVGVFLALMTAVRCGNSEQRLRFCGDGGQGRRRKKNMDFRVS